MAWLFVAAVGLYTAVAAGIDLRMHRIPNWVTVPAAALGLAYHTLAPGGFGPLVSLAGLAVGFSLLLLPWLLGGGGMGDVKLLAALGAWLGPLWMLAAFAASAVMAALLTLLILFTSVTNRGITRTTRKYMSNRRPRDLAGRRRKSRVLPFAVPVAMSTWMLLAWLVAHGRL
jgi:prepilin peptidase CpaA